MATQSPPPLASAGENHQNSGVFFSSVYRKFDFLFFKVNLEFFLGNSYYLYLTLQIDNGIW